MNKIYDLLLVFLKNGYTSFRSPRTTVIIITVLLGLYLLGLIIPQKALIPTADVYAEWKADYPKLSAVIEYLHLNEIYLAPMAILFPAIFFANLLELGSSRSLVSAFMAHLRTDNPSACYARMAE